MKKTFFITFLAAISLIAAAEDKLPSTARCNVKDFVLPDCVTPAASAMQRDRVLGRVVPLMEKAIHVHPAVGQYVSGYGENIYSVEVFFDALWWLYRGRDDLALNTFQLYISPKNGDVHPNGHIPRHLDVVTRNQGVRSGWFAFEYDEQAQPFLWQTALLLSRAKGSAAWLTDQQYEILRRYLDRWRTAWDRDHNGLCEWASAPHAVADTQFERCGVWRSYFDEAVDLNCFLFIELRAAHEIALARGRQADADQFAQQADHLYVRIQKTLWDDKDHFFYDRDIRSGQLIRVKTVQGFIPLWAGVATPTQAAQMVKEHLLDPKQFWLPFLIPSYSRSEPGYTQHHRPPAGKDVLYYLDEGHADWRGGVWPHTNYWIVHGLWDYGFHDEARQIAARQLAMMDVDHPLAEWFNAETGKGQGGIDLTAGAEALGALLSTELAAELSPTRIQPVDHPLRGCVTR